MEKSKPRAQVLDIETRSTENDHEDLRLWLRLLSCTVKIENQLRARLRQDFESTLPRFDLMAQLERNPEGLRMTALSERLMVTCGNITGITDQLEREGLVVRTPRPARPAGQYRKLDPDWTETISRTRSRSRGMDH